MAALSLKMHASYSAMLFVQLKQSLAVKGVWHPSGDISTTPILLPSALDAPSKKRVHRDPCSGPSYGLISSQLSNVMMSSFGIQTSWTDNLLQLDEQDDQLTHLPL